MAKQPTPDPKANTAKPATGPVAVLLDAVSWPAKAAARKPFLVALVALTGIAIAAPFYFFSVKPASTTVIAANGEEILAALDAGDDATAEALAKKMERQRLAMSADRSAAFYTLGTMISRRAERMLGGARLKLHRQAAEYLTKSARLGFPDGRDATGAYYLGKSLLLSGQNNASRAPLAHALENGRGRFKDIHRLLAGAYLHEPKSNPAAALKSIDMHLAKPSLSQTDQRESELLRAEILFRLNDAAACRDSLEPLLADPESRSAAKVLQARLLMAEGERLRDSAKAAHDDAGLAVASQTFQQAIELLRETQARAPRDHNTSATCMYLIGICYLDLDDERAAFNEFERTYKRYVESPEGWAALIEIGDLQTRTNQDAAALQSYSEAVRVSKHLIPDSNPWVSQEEFRERLLKAFATFVERARFTDAITLAETFIPPYTENESRQFRAQAYQAWGRKLIADAPRTGPTQELVQKRLGRAKLRIAGELYADLALKHFSTRGYPEDRWNSAECYLEAQNYPVAIRYMREFLSLTSRRDRPRTLVALGRALLALGQYPAAVDALRECIEYHLRHPAVFEARLVCSNAYFELGDNTAAKQCLLDNLDGDRLTPASREWRESLFALGRLLHDLAEYPAAIQRLSEAIERYPEDHHALSALYLVADSHLQLAANFSNRLKTEQVEKTRGDLIRDRRLHAEQAAEIYQRVTSQLMDREGSMELTALEVGILQTSIFNHAAVLVSLSRTAEAIESYTLALNRYQNSPEALSAYVQLARCYRRSNDPLEAQNALALAGVVLDRIKPEAQFVPLTGFTRDAWTDYLDWLKTL